MFENTMVNRIVSTLLSVVLVVALGLPVESITAAKAFAADATTDTEQSADTGSTDEEGTDSTTDADASSSDEDTSNDVATVSDDETTPDTDTDDTSGDATSDEESDEETTDTVDTSAAFVIYSYTSSGWTASASYTDFSSAVSARNASDAGYCYILVQDDLTLTSDVSFTNSSCYGIVVTGEVTIDLGGYTMSFATTYYSIEVSGTSASLTLKNGTITDTAKTTDYETISVMNGASLTTSDLTVKTTAPSSGMNYIVYSYTYSGGTQSVTLGENTVLQSVDSDDSGGTVVGVAIMGTGSDTTATSGNALTLDKATITTSSFAISGNGSVHGTTITIDDSTITSTAATAIFLPQNGTTVITDSTIKGALCGIEIRAGILVINGDTTVTSTATSFNCGANGSGTTTKGAAIAISQHTSNIAISVTLNDGTYSGLYAVYEYDTYDENTDDIEVSITGGTYTSTGTSSSSDDTTSYSAVYSQNCTSFISGGSFSTSVASSYPAVGYGSSTVSTEGDDGTTTTSYVVAATSPAVVISTSTDDDGTTTTTTTAYTSLSAAFSAATSGDTVQVLQDCTVSSRITISTDVTLDLNGCTVTCASTSARIFYINTTGSLTVKDSSSAGTGTVTNSSYTGSYGLFDVYGSLTIESGTYVDEGAGDGATIKGRSGSSIIISGGTFSVSNSGSKSSSLVGNFVVSASYCCVEISGGTYTVGSNCWGAIKLECCTALEGESAVTVSGVTITCDSTEGIELMATDAVISGSTITVSQALTGSYSYLSTAIAVNNQSEVTVESGTYSAPYAVYVYSSGGTVTIEDGTFTGTISVLKADVDTYDNSTGTSTSEATDEGSHIIVEGGTFNGEFAIAESDSTTLLVSGGTFTTEVAWNYCADGYVPATASTVTNEDGTTTTYYTVEEGEFTASVTTTDSDGTETLVAKYTDLQEAIDAAEKVSLSDGESVTVTMLTDVTIYNYYLDISSSLTLDLGGNELTFATTSSIYSGAIYIEDGDVTITNGTITDKRCYGYTASGVVCIWMYGDSLTTSDVTIQMYSPNSTKDYNYIIYVQPDGYGNYPSVTLDEGTSILDLGNSHASSGYSTLGCVGVTLLGATANSGAAALAESTDTTNYTSLTVNDGTTITTKGLAISGSGSNHGTVITINGGTITSTGSTAIYHPQYGYLYVNGGTITGAETGIEIRAGHLIMTGGTVTGQGAPTETQANGNGTTCDGAGIAVSQHTTNLILSVTITGGTVTGYTALYEADTTGDGDTSGISLSITGGTFVATGEDSDAIYSEDCTEFVDAQYDEDGNVTVVVESSTVIDSMYCADGYVPTTTRNSDGMYTIEVGTFLASLVATTTSTDEDGEETTTSETVARYTSVQDAIDAAAALAEEDEGTAYTVVLLSDATEDVSVPEGLTVTLDLGGYTLTGESGYALKNYGDLTIVDSGRSETTTDDDGDETTTTYTGGIVSNVYAGAAVLNYSGATCVIEGGDFSANAWYVVENLGSLTITGGTFTGGLVTSALIANALIAEADEDGTDGTVTISGGTFTAGNSGAGELFGWSSTTYDGGSLSITGGDFTGSLANLSSSSIPYSVSISGVASDEGEVESAPTFSEAVSSLLCATGWVPMASISSTDASTYIYSVTLGDNVAALYDTDGTTLLGYYTTVSAAVSAASAGQTVKLLEDVELSSFLGITKSITLDLGGHTISSSSSYSQSWLVAVYLGADVTITNGSISTSASNGTIVALYIQQASVTTSNLKITVNGSSGCAVQVGNNKGSSSTVYWGSFTMNEGTVITAKGSAYGVLVCGPYTTSDVQSDDWDADSATLTTFTMNGGSVTVVGDYAVCGNGTYNGTVITINGGSITSTTGAAIYHPQYGTLTLNGGTLSGVVGVQMCAGELIVPEGSTVSVTATGTSSSSTTTGDGTVYDGAAISIISRGYSTDPTVTIAGGSFVSATGVDAVQAYALSSGETSTWDGAEDAVEISGGSFSTVVDSLYCADGYVPSTQLTVTNDDGTTTTYYTVVTGTFVAAVVDEDGYTEAYYASLQDAVDAADKTDTVVLLSDVTVSTSLTISSTVTLDLAGYTLSNSSDGTGDTIVVQSGGNLTLIDSSAEYDEDGTLTTAGTGVVDSVLHGEAALYVQEGGTATLKGGTLKRSQEAGTLSPYSANGNSFYTIWNQGTLTIEDGTTVELLLSDGTAAGYSSIICNGWPSGSPSTDGYLATLTINGGTINGGKYVKNDSYGKLIVTGGSIINGADASLLNWNVATISGGYFEPSDTAGGVLFNCASSATYECGDLDVSGGTFIYDDDQELVPSASTSDDVSISGGTFSTVVDLQYCADGYIPTTTTNSDGLYEVEKGTYVAALYTSDGELSAYYSDLQTAIDAANGGTVVMLADVTADVTVSVTVTLDLNGHTLTNASSHTITVKAGGDLTLVDSSATDEYADGDVEGSATGEGVVDNVTTKKAALYVQEGGTATLSGGTLRRSAETGDATNTYYTVLNQGTLSIEDGTTVELLLSDGTAAGYSSVIDNGWYSGSPTTDDDVATLYINGGYINGGKYVKNDSYGVMYITGGTIAGSADASAILNWNELSVSGGTIESDGYCAILNCSTDGKDYETGSVTITGGTFVYGEDSTSAQLLATNSTSDDVEISGGSFSTQVDEGYCAEGYKPFAQATEDNNTYYTVSTFEVTLNEDTYTYTGETVALDVTVVFGGETLEATDYDVTYAPDGVNAGTVTATVSATSSSTTFVGSEDVTITIVAKELTSDMVKLSATSFTYDGTTQVPTVTVTDDSLDEDSQTLTSGTDYKVYYNATSSVDAGTYTVSIVGIGNYTGTVDATYTNSQANLSGATIESIAAQAYTGSAITPDVVVTYKGLTLEAKEDYTVSYSDNIEVGTATVTVTATEGGNYTGTATATFSIAKYVAMVTTDGGETYTYYSDLVEAVKAARGSSGETTTTVGVVTLLADCDLTTSSGAGLSVYGDLTIDLNGHTMTVGIVDNWALQPREGASVTITDSSEDAGGTVSLSSNASYGLVYTTAACSVELSDITVTNVPSGVAVIGLGNTDGSAVSVTLTNVTVTGAGTAVMQWSTYDGVACNVELDLDVTGGSYTSTASYGFAFNGTLAGDSTLDFDGVTISSYEWCVDNQGATMTLTECTFTVTGTGSEYYYTAVATTNGGSTVINSGTYTAPYAVYVFSSGGTVTINGGTFIGSVNALKADADSYDNGTEDEGSTIVVVDGVVKGSVDITEASGSAGDASGEISGGWFQKQVDEKDCAEGYKPYATATGTDDVSGMYTVGTFEVTLNEDTYTYTGEGVELDTTVVFGGEMLASTSYGYVYYDEDGEELTSAPTDVGTYSAAVTSTNSSAFNGTSETFEFTIVAADLSDATIGDIAAQTFTGSEITPSVTVSLDDETLTAYDEETESGDYTVTYVNNVNAGTAFVVIEGTGNYTGTLYATFTINTGTLSVGDIDSQTYTGSEITPSVTVTNAATSSVTDAVTPTLGTDYTVSYSNNIDVGTATVTVTGYGNYAGSTATKTFAITAKSITDATVSVSPASATYTGSDLTPEVSVTLGEGDDAVTLEEGTDYTVAYTDSDGNTVAELTSVGTYTVTVTGTGNYTGTVSPTSTFTISKATPTVTLDDITVTYGDEYSPSATVTGADGEEISGATVTYTYYSDENLTSSLTTAPADAGTYYVKATYAGNDSYSEASATATLTIEAADLADATVTLSYDTVTYDGTAKTPPVTVKMGDTDLSSSDYTVTYADNTNAGTATVTVTAAEDGNYTGTATATFTIVNASISFTSANYEGTYDGSAHGITVTAATSGATVEYSTDGTTYSTDEITYTNSGTYTVYYKISLTNYNDVTGYGTVTITKADQELSYADSAVTAHINDSSVSNALTQTTVVGTVSYTSSDTSVATIDSTGVVTIVAAGTTTITATAAATDNYNEATASYELTVTGHAYENEPTWTWTETSDGYTATATFTCSVDDDCTVTSIQTATVTSTTVDATCTTDGSTTYTATVTQSDTTYTDTKTVETEATGHSYESEVTTEATCTEDGVTTYTCSVCGDTYTEAITATGHSYTSVKTDATCAEAGYTTYTCSVCGDVYYTAGDKATGHDWGDPVWTWSDDYSVAVATSTCKNDSTHVAYATALATNESGNTITSETTTATCTENGSVTYTATVTIGGETKTDTQTVVLEATGHDYEAVVTDPTCTEQGYTTYTCSACDDSYVDDYVDATGHSYESEVTTEATCTEAGVTTYTCSACGDTYTEAIAATGHSLTKTEAVSATCTTAGSEAYWTCDTCGLLFSDEGGTTQIDSPVTVSATGHTYGDWITVTDATCTDDGFKYRVCSVCGYTETSGIDATGHTWESDYTVDVEATCTTDGSKSIHCSECDAVKDSTTISATGHSYESVVTDPTCTEQGYTTYTCSVCGDTYVDDYTDATGHSYTSEVTTEATCTEDGVTTYTCSVCGDTYTEAIEATGHSWSAATITWSDDHSMATATRTCFNDSTHVSLVAAEVTSEETAATCTEAGSVTYTATATFADGTTATDTVTVEVEATGHDYEAVVTDPTCTEQGYTTYTCSACGDTYVDDYTDATGHSYASEVTTEATCTEDGVTTYTCSVCGDSYTEAIEATGHSYDEGEVTTEPTCTEEGVKTYTCSACGDTYTEAIAATGHSYDDGVVTEATCTEAGYTTYTCSVCGDVYYKAGEEATGHDYEAVVTDPTCTEQGYTTYTCSVCGDSYVDDYVDATGHSYTSEVTTEATCTEDGVTTYTCSVCGDTYTEAISAIGHSFTDYVSNGDATCTEDGTKTASCDNGCGETDTVADEGSATGHSWSDATFTWSDDYTVVVATSTCENDPDEVSYATATVANGGIVVTVDGDTTTYTATVTVGERTQTDVQTVTTTTVASLDGASVSVDEQTYTGEALTPAVTVTLEDGTVLTEGTDYTVDYLNNTDVGTGIVVVTGIGSYEGTVVGVFTIDAADVADVEVSAIDDQTYTGSAIEPEVTVEGLTEGEDYTVTYGDNVETGTASVVITGIGNYTGTQTVSFDIVAASLEGATISSIDDQTYTGDELTPVVTVTLADGTVLTEGTDYTVTYADNVETGTATVTVTGIGNYTGTVSGSFDIVAASIEDATIEIDEVTYTGSAVEPDVTVTDAEGNVLTEGVDYTLTYSDNTEAGTGTVTVTGIGNYTGTATATFTIDSESLEDAYESSFLEIEDQYFDGQYKTPSVTIVIEGYTLVEGVDYTLSYSDNLHPGTATVTITGIGNYSGTYTTTFEIIIPESDYNDLTRSAWYTTGIDYVTALEVMTGYDDGSGDFGVGGNLTRAELAVIMWRIAEPEEAAAYEASVTANTTGMSDVKSYAWYTGAANWCVENDVIQGKVASDGTRYFDPTAPVTFQQLLAVLANYIDPDGRDALTEAEMADVLDDFSDGDEVSSWAKQSTVWSIQEGIVQGYSNTDGTISIAPKEDVKRQRVALVLMNAFEADLLLLPL